MLPTLPLSILCVLCLFALAPAAPKTPAAGWCKTAHTPDPKAAQSGYRGYCKPCFRSLFPDEYTAKQNRRKKSCTMCGNVQEMVANGLCRPCHRSRSCETCHGVNFDVAARVCDRCSETRQMQGASQGRLAMWCATCNTPDQIAVELCKMCFDKQSRLGGCHHCRAAVDFSSRMLTCAETGCGVRTRFCCQCAAVFANYPDLSCKTCWHANGDICISCHRRTGQHHLDKYRHCKLCIRNIFCVECRAPPAANLVVRNCRMCSLLALVVQRALHRS